MKTFLWIDCAEMPEALSYEQINKSSFRHKGTLMPVIATGFDSSYGTIRNHDGEHVSMDDLQYLADSDDLLNPQEYTEKYYTHQSNDGVSAPRTDDKLKELREWIVSKWNFPAFRIDTVEMIEKIDSLLGT